MPPLFTVSVFEFIPKAELFPDDEGSRIDRRATGVRVDGAERDRIARVGRDNQRPRAGNDSGSGIRRASGGARGQQFAKASGWCLSFR